MKNTRFYTNITKSSNTMLVREIVDGIPSLRRDMWQPTYYIKDINADSEYVTLYGDKVKSIKPGNMFESREWCKQYANISGFDIFGQQNEILQYANEYDSHGWDLNLIKVYSLDIEVGSPPARPDGSGGGFPDPKFALGEIQLITIQDIHTKRCYTWGTKKYVPTGKHNVTTSYTECIDEKNLLKLFLTFWQQSCPDIITGWHVDGFDVPYLINRIQSVLGNEFAKKLSPWNQVDFKLRNYKGAEEIEYNITGVSVLDMMLLMKKFTTNARESWALGAVAQEELGITKLENPAESFYAFYSDHFSLFVEYNIVDSMLVTQLEEKLKLISLALTIAYEAKINYNDVFSPVKTWDAILHNELLAKNVVSPQRQSSGVNAFSIEGAYVKTPVPGMYKNVVAFDFLSMYPSIMIALNLSPETYLGQCDSTVDLCLSGVIPNTDPNITMGANGSLFGKKKLGIIPAVIKTYMKKRRDAKNEMLGIEQQIEAIKDQLKSLD